MKKMIVAFHIGRGGRHNNAGHKSFNGNVKSLKDCFNKCTIINDDEDGNILPDDEWVLLDGGDNIILQGRNEIDSETGILDFDGDYDTDIVEYVEDCTDEELRLICDAWKDGEYIDDDILAYALLKVDYLNIYRGVATSNADPYAIESDDVMKEIYDSIARCGVTQIDADDDDISDIRARLDLAADDDSEIYKTSNIYFAKF